jgi:hypothetical protein
MYRLTKDALHIGWLVVMWTSVERAIPTAIHIFVDRWTGAQQALGVETLRLMTSMGYF